MIADIMVQRDRWPWAVYLRNGEILIRIVSEKNIFKTRKSQLKSWAHMKRKERKTLGDFPFRGITKGRKAREINVKRV